MKRSTIVALLAAVGCSVAPDQAPPADERPAAPVVRTKEDQISELRVQLQAKRADLAQAEADLARVEAEREKLGKEPASEAKTTRLSELARVEADTKVRKGALTSEVTTLEKQINDLTLAARPKSADEALDLALEAGQREEKEAAERRRKKEEEAAMAEKARFESAEAARKAEELARKREAEKLAAERNAIERTKTGFFDDDWDPVILRIQAELQRFKRW